MALLTASEMHYESRLIYESIISGTAPAYTPREWSELLTKAQEIEIREIIKEGLDKNEENRKSIDRLIIYSSISGASIVAGTSKPNSYTVNLPSDYYYILSKYAKLTESTQQLIKVVPISNDAYKSNIRNPYKKPFVNDNNQDGLVWELVYNSSNNRQIMIIVPSNYTLSKIELEYIKNPTPIIIPYSYSIGSIQGYDLTNPINQAGVDCELSSIIQSKIVRRAADLAAAYSRDKVGYQMQKIEGKEPQ